MKRMSRSQFSMGSMTVTNRQTRVSMFWIGIALVVVAVLAISALKVAPAVPVVNELPVISSLASQRNPAKVVESFYKYLADGDVKSACKLADTDFKSRLLKDTNGLTFSVRSCEDLWTVALNIMDAEDKKALKSIKVRRASVNGNVAVVRNRDVTFQSAPSSADSSLFASGDPNSEFVSLVRKNSKWYLHGWSDSS